MKAIFCLSKGDLFAHQLVKFVYSEKATKFCEIFTLLLSTIHTDKIKVEISHNFVAFSKYMNFNSSLSSVYPLIQVKKFGDIISLVRRGLDHHFSLLSSDLEASDGPYICGSEYTLADVSMVPIFERMEYARWWTDSLKV